MRDRSPNNADNPFALPAGCVYRGWTTREGGCLERGGGPLVMRIEPDRSTVGAGYTWRVLCHSWVEPALVELDSGTARNMYIAKAQAFWAAYAQLMAWCRSLTDDGMIG